MNHVKAARSLANILDNQFSLFGIRFGWDTIIGLVPGIGDTVTAVFSCYILWIAWTHRVPAPLLLRMLLNIGFDTLLSAIPIIGDVFDIFVRANMKNVALLEKYLDSISDEDVIELKPNP